MARADRPTVKHIYPNYILDSTHWHGFQVRDGDIVIATSYKTGTTWMQGICAALVFQASEPRPHRMTCRRGWMPALPLQRRR
jgi:aryl sulfotransferase